MKRKILKIISVYRLLDCNIFALIRFVKLNFFSKHIRRYNGFFYPYPNLEIEWAEGAIIELNDSLYIGKPTSKNSKKYSRLVMGRNSRIKIDGRAEFLEGCDLQILDNSNFYVAKFHSNIDLEVLCGYQIRFCGEVTIGRHVRIKDYNGHYTTSELYPRTKAVIVEGNVWICTGTTLNAGTYICSGSVIMDESNVWGTIPENSLVQGNPAKVIDTDIKFEI